MSEAKARLSCSFSDYRGVRTDVAQQRRDSPAVQSNLTVKSINIQKRRFALYDERVGEQNKSIKALGKKLNGLEKSDGPQYVWRIDHYQVGSFSSSSSLFMVIFVNEERLGEDRKNKRTTLFSPQFLTSRHGYRLALSICLCGNGKG